MQVEREIINHSCLIHPHIVRFRECFLTPEYLGIAMEYAAGGDLYRFVAAKCALLLRMLPAIWRVTGPDTA